MDTNEPYTIDPELATLLKDAAAAERSVTISIDNEAYILSVRPEPSGVKAALWANYDPEQVRATVRRSVAMGSSADPADLDPLIAEIRAERDQASGYLAS